MYPCSGIGASQHRALWCGWTGKESSAKQARFSCMAASSCALIARHAPIQLHAAFPCWLKCEPEVELDRLFAALAAGGKAMTPLDAYPFSKRFGWLADKYGVSRQLRLCQ